MSFARGGGSSLSWGWFNETLPGAIEKVSLLRLDSDLYETIHDTLTRLYPRLSIGAYVIFDDFKFTQAHGRPHLRLPSEAFHHLAAAPLQPGLETSFNSLDKMVYWQKSQTSG